MSEEKHTLSRRAALQGVTAALGGLALTGGAGLLTAAFPDSAEARTRLARETEFTADDIEWLETAADTLLPETHTPGARAAATGAFIAVMVSDCYTPAEQAVFRQGMREMDAWALAEHGAGLTALDNADRTSVLEHFDQAQKEYMDNKADEALAHPFRMFKEQALLGYFTSKTGMVDVLGYTEVPGRFDPCVEI